MKKLVFILLASRMLVGMEQEGLYKCLLQQLNTTNDETVLELVLNKEVINTLPLGNSQNIVAYGFDKIPDSPYISNNKTFFITQPFKSELKQKSVVQNHYSHVLHILEQNKKPQSYVLHPKAINDGNKGLVDLFEPNEIFYKDTYEYIIFENGQWIADPNPEKFGDTSTLGDIAHTCPNRGFGHGMGCNVGACELTLEHYSFEKLLFIFTLTKTIKGRKALSKDQIDIEDDVIGKTVVIKGVSQDKEIKFFYHSFPKNNTFFGEEFFIHNHQLVSKYVHASKDDLYNTYDEFVPYKHPNIKSAVDIVKSFYGDKFFEKIDLVNKQLTCIDQSCASEYVLKQLASDQLLGWQEMFCQLNQNFANYRHHKIADLSWIDKHQTELKQTQDFFNNKLNQEKYLQLTGTVDFERIQLKKALIDKITESLDAFIGACDKLKSPESSVEQLKHAQERRSVM